MANENSEISTQVELSNGLHDTAPTVPAVRTENEAPGEKEGKPEHESVAMFQITVKLPNSPYETQVMVSPQEQVYDLRQSIVEIPDTFQYSCFRLEFHGKRINDAVDLSDVEGVQAGSEITLVEEPYTEKEARMHVIRVRELIGAVGDRSDTLHGICSGISLHDTVCLSEMMDLEAASSAKANAGAAPAGTAHAMTDYEIGAPASLATILPPPKDLPPKTIKSISLSPWNPPPPHLRQKGHLMYLQLTTNEGEQFQITSHVSGFWVNRSSNSKFDPLIRAAPKNQFSHSLLNLIPKLSPSFETSFRALQESNMRQEPLAIFQITNAIPHNPWLVPAAASTHAHQADPMRSQENYLMTGVENGENLRDWNEEFQSTRELPRDSVPDRVVRERLLSRLFADYNEAAVRGAMLVARGEVGPLNPTEHKDAQIFVYNNIFFSYGADGVGTFTSEGGDEAARVAVSKDVAGIRMVNQFDIDGLHAPGTTVVDYLGKRLVGQSIVPGIFKQREPGENQIDYGGVDGREVVAENPAFVATFSKLSEMLRVKKHDVWDKDGKKHTLEASVETKGLLGTDGRKYILDLYRLTPLDISWLESYWTDDAGQAKPRETNYPHRMAILRPEAIEAYYRYKLEEFVATQVGPKPVSNGVPKAEEAKPVDGHANTANPSASTVDADAPSPPPSEGTPRVDLSSFKLSFNPDVFCGQAPPDQQAREEWEQDEKDVRAICTHVVEHLIPDLVLHLKEGEVGFPMDGQSLTRLMHKRGINVRYLGRIASLSKDQSSSRLDALARMALQEMIARGFKHVVNELLRDLPSGFACSCFAHLLNCLLGVDLNKSPKAQVDEDLHALYREEDFAFMKMTPEILRSRIQEQVHLRYRYTLEDRWFSQFQHVQLLRDVSLKLGLQISAKDFKFRAPPTNGTTNGSPIGTSYHGKKKKKNLDHDPSSSTESLVPKALTTFEPDDIVNFLPVVKESAPKSSLAEEALEAGRLSIAQGQRDMGQELLLESLSLHEQIYGILHPEVARVHHQLSMLYYQLDEKAAAVELARKAVIVSERTLGLDASETTLAYLNLGLFEHAVGRTRLALCYIRHALDVWNLIYGPRHPDVITTINNAAVMLQQLKLYHESRIWFERSLDLAVAHSGAQSVAAATLSFQLSQALALDADPKAAVARMRDAYTVFHACLGPDDRNTREADAWLEQLTQNAVSIARHAKDVQQRRLRRMQLSPHVVLATRPQAGVGEAANRGESIGPAAAAAAATMAGELSAGDLAAAAAAVTGKPGGLDSRSLDELIRFIEGGESARVGKGKKLGRGNPKRRGTSGTAVKTSG